MTITIRHTHLDGTLVEGTRRGDGVYELIGPRTEVRFKWFPSIQMIGIPQSRDRVAQRYRIERAAEILRTAGHEVTVEIDDAPRPRAQVLADQAERLDDRHDALTAKAGKQAAESEALWRRSDDLVRHIPPGQPILIGHHSERSHRNTLEKSQNAAFAALYKGREAKETAQRADAVGSNAQYAASAMVTGRRIERLEAELRDIDRKLTGYERNSLNGRGEVVYVERHAPAAGMWREQLEARRVQLVEQLEHDRAHVAAAVEAGAHKVFGPNNVKAGDQVYYLGRWRTVKKVNKVTVSCASGYSWDDKIRFTDLGGHRPTGEGSPEPTQ